MAKTHRCPQCGSETKVEPVNTFSVAVFSVSCVSEECDYEVPYARNVQIAECLHNDQCVKIVKENEELEDMVREMREKMEMLCDEADSLRHDLKEVNEAYNQAARILVEAGIWKPVEDEDK